MELLGKCYAMKKKKINPAPQVRLPNKVRSKTTYGTHLEKGDNVIVDPYCKIGDYCLLGDGVKILGISTLGDKVRIGANSDLFEVTIRDNVRIGKNCHIDNTLIHHGTRIGNHVSIGDHSIIGSKCQVGDDIKLPPETHLKHGSRIFYKRSQGEG
ncbi:MAG: NDP-sugar synthase [Candidatus Parvarchaeum sp.]